MRKSTLQISFAVTLMAASVGFASASETAAKKPLVKAYPGTAYSPYAENGHAISPLPLWGETHLHTGYSMDAGVLGSRLTHEDAYRYSRGDQITASSGQPAKLSRPLDWVVITDHSDQMGMVQDIISADPAIMKTEQGKRWNAGIKAGGNEAVKAALDLVTTFAQGKFDPILIDLYAPDSEKYASVWKYMLDTAQEYNEPGRFTAMIGYEWTSLVKGANMHRNVIFRGNEDSAGQIVPYSTQAPLGSTNPLDLYNWLETYEKKTGTKALAIAHNGNLSNGIMFPVDAQYDGTKIDKKYVEARAKWERLYEVTQIKGDGEAHPKLSPDDEFADFGNWDVGNLDISAAKEDSMLQYEYARAALKNGLALEAKLGTNPYKFGLVGATDSHTGMPTIEEENFMGKHTGYEASAERLTHSFMKTKHGELFSWQQQAAGAQAVWSPENTRTGIYDAMDRKETYATTGPRITVRFFGGWDFTESDALSRDVALFGYKKGVPMGGDLKPANGKKAPNFMVYALRDQIGANLDRVQIVKGWTDSKGETHEKVYNAAWSDNRKMDSKGNIPAVGNTVNFKNASWTNTIGASELATVWTDPDFDASQRAFYYARILEIPTPRWIVYDAYRYGIEIPKDAVKVDQERAYTSPIWYTPKS